ncbi:MAG: hypothetical protein JNN03_15810 [Rubrivivax sp.]|nr:hypothetical protein [Rubrivivax sp.]
MLNDLWLDMAAWWATVPPEFAFLFALPFAVAAAGLGADRLRRHRPGAEDPR